MTFIDFIFAVGRMVRHYLNANSCHVPDARKTVCDVIGLLKNLELIRANTASTAFLKEMGKSCRDSYVHE